MVGANDWAIPVYDMSSLQSEMIESQLRRWHLGDAERKFDQLLEVYKARCRKVKIYLEAPRIGVGT